MDGAVHMGEIGDGGRAGWRQVVGAAAHMVEWGKVGVARLAPDSAYGPGTVRHRTRQGGRTAYQEYHSTP